jgi:hypothetical protein
VLLPFFYIVLARGVTGFRSQFVTVVSITLVVAVNVVTLVTFLQRGDEWTVYKPNPDWRAAARYFDDELAGTANRLFVFASTPATPLTYYDERFFEGIPLVDRDHRKLAQIQRVLGADHPIANIVSAEVEEYSQSMVERHTQARLFIRYVDTNDLEPLNETLTDSNVSNIYFVHNRYWSGEFEDLFEMIVRNPRITTQASVDFKGIEIYKFGVAKHQD